MTREPRNPDEAELATRHRLLERTWGTGPGLWARLTTVDHKIVGRRYIITGFVFFVLAGILALLMRTQLATPQSGLISADRYNQIFSMHGTTMMFLFAVPIMEAMGVYLVPLMCGTRNISFPRLNAFSYWTYLAGGVMIWVAFLLNIGPETGWFSYVPLAGPEFSPGKRTDFWAQMITFTEVAALSVAVELVATILKQRAPGMTLARMPLFLWAMLVTSVMIIFAMPAVMLCSTFLISDRLVGTHFYNPVEGGDALLWQHLFWFFGHPEVYIIFLPALGMVSSIVGTFSRRTVFAYPAMVVALLANGFLAFGLWVHHMFATGLPRLGNSFYTSASMMIALPAGVQIFAWIATLCRRQAALQNAAAVRHRLHRHLRPWRSDRRHAGVSVPFDLQAHDTYFVVAHFHYVLIGGAVFPLFGGFYYWFPKVTGRMSDERAAVEFLAVLCRLQRRLLPDALLGLMGMPRRVYTYLPGLGWALWNQIATAGAFMIAISVADLHRQRLRQRARGAPGRRQPLGSLDAGMGDIVAASRLQLPYVPVVTGREALWQPGECAVDGRPFQRDTARYSAPR
jgi:cytochrome c oxidase subunit I+III